MPNVPIWVYGVALVALLVLLGMTIFQSPNADSSLQPNVISTEQALAQLPFDQDIATLSLAEVETGSLSILSIQTATSAHYHKKSSEIAYVLSGQGRAISKDAAFELKPGQLLIVFAGTPIRLERSGDQALALLVFSTPRPTEDDVVSVESVDHLALAGALKPMVMDVAERMTQRLQQSPGDLEFTVIAEIEPTGSAELCRVKEKVALHHQIKENRMLYIVKGRARATIGKMNTELAPGEIVIIPAGIEHKLERIGDEPVDFVLFSTPPFVEKDTVWDARN